MDILSLVAEDGIYFGGCRTIRHALAYPPCDHLLLAVMDHMSGMIDLFSGLWFELIPRLPSVPGVPSISL